MKTYKYKVQGVEYEVEIAEVVGKIAKVNVNGIPFEIEMQKPINAAKHPALASTKRAVAAAPVEAPAAAAPVAAPAKSQAAQPAAPAGAGNPVKAPLPGTINAINVKVGDKVNVGDVVIVLEAMKMQNNIEAEYVMGFTNFIVENFNEFLTYTGFANVTAGNLIMIAVGAFFIWLAIKKDFEPLLLVPIGLGIILGNIPFRADAGLEIGLYEDNSVLNIFYQGVRQGWYPPLIFLGIGAMTDFSALLANPKLMLIGAAAQFGIFGAYMFALALGFEPNQAAGIAIIGGADGPTAIFLSSKLSPNLMGAIAVCAYSYMALVPLIQPPLMRLLTTKKERLIKMKPAREVSQTERILFPIVGLLLTTFIVPSGLPLLGMLFFGNLLKESGKTTRLAKTAGAALNDIVVMLLGLTVGCSTQASEFLTMNTIYIFAIGAGAFIIATMSGVCFVKLMNVFLPKDKKLNPLIGNAGVSAVPMAARISNNLGLEYDRHNFLLMHAMGPNVAGVIGSAVAAGALLGFLS